MRKNTLMRVAVPGVLLGVMTIVITQLPPGTLRNLPAQSHCVGLPYGSSGCPLKDDLHFDDTSSETPPLNCGDGHLDPDEECDLGRFNGLSNCTEDCKLLYCGDGIVTPYIGEECEPETQEVYVIDPVTYQLTVEVQFVEKLCGTYCEPPRCNTFGECTGGCIVRFGEPCANEDGGQSATEAEKTAGTQETQAVAGSEPSPDTTSIPTASSEDATTGTQYAAAPAEGICGDGIVQQGEECDDGDANSDTAPNACRTDCTLPVCGDGVVDRGEACDDGDANSDTTPNTCRTNCTLPVCGDGVVDRGEECDDGNANSDTAPNACRTDCTISVCGDGVIDRGEECDDGNRNNFDDCPNNCMLPVCGNGIREGREECDDGNRINDDGCTNECRLPRCGDGIVQKDEKCDDGDANSDIKPNACRTDCALPVCGDGVIDRGEECDDGDENSDTKPNACRTDCTRSHCGDGVLDRGEACDDGNADSGDGCDRNCAIERGWFCTEEPSVCTAICGDGLVRGDEECDDGNTDNADGCDGDCAIEAGWFCTGEPNICTAICGDGLVRGDEECDDGNTVSGDGCSSDCKLEAVCGNGILEHGEECDGGKWCSDQCTHITFFGTVYGKAAGGGGVLLAAGLMFILLRRFLRQSRMRIAHDQSVSLDDIPLDELEMPWHRWERG